MLVTKNDLKALEEALEEKVETLRDKIFKNGIDTSYTCYSAYPYEAGSYLWRIDPLSRLPKSLEERLSDGLERIKKRQELLMKHLGIKFVEVDAVDKHEEIRKVKESTHETSSRKKTCKKCGEFRPITDYHKNKNNKSGRRNVCKFCISEYMKAYALKH